MDGGGSLMNQGVHRMDLIQWLGGRVASVYGAFGVFAHEIEAEDKTVACLHFENGALGTLTTTTAAYGGGTPVLLVHGDKGTVQLFGGMLNAWKMADDEEGAEERELLALYGPKDEKSEAEKLSTDPMALSATGHTFLVGDLAAAVREDRAPYITIEQATHAVEVINAIYESGRTGQAVTVGS
jgi:predicted dehydrogenase